MLCINNKPIKNDPFMGRGTRMAIKYFSMQQASHLSRRRLVYRSDPFRRCQFYHCSDTYRVAKNYTLWAFQIQSSLTMLYHLCLCHEFGLSPDWPQSMDNACEQLPLLMHFLHPLLSCSVSLPIPQIGYQLKIGRCQHQLHPAINEEYSF